MLTSIHDYLQGFIRHYMVRRPATLLFLLIGLLGLATFVPYLWSVAIGGIVSTIAFTGYMFSGMAIVRESTHATQKMRACATTWTRQAPDQAEAANREKMPS